METGTVVAIVATSASNAIAFGVVLLKIGRITERLELMWEWYMDEHSPVTRRRRRSDHVTE